MKVTFEIKTTCSRPFHITVDEDIPMFQVRKMIMSDVEYYTILMKDNVIDLFIPYGNDCVSIPEISTDTVRTFIDRYPDYFNVNNKSLWSTFHQLFIMDHTYLDKLKSNNEAPIYRDVDIIPPTETSNIKNVFNIAVALVTGINMKLQ